MLVLYSGRTAVFVCVSVCLLSVACVCLIRHLGGVGPVERSDNGVYLSSVCLSVCVLVHHLRRGPVQLS